MAILISKQGPASRPSRRYNKSICSRIATTQTNAINNNGSKMTVAAASHHAPSLRVGLDAKRQSQAGSTTRKIKNDPETICCNPVIGGWMRYRILLLGTASASSPL